MPRSGVQFGTEPAGLGSISWVDGRSLRAWYLKLSLPAGELEGAPQLVELIPKGVPKAIGRGFVIRRGDVETELGPNFDEEALGRVLRMAGIC